MNIKTKYIESDKIKLHWKIGMRVNTFCRSELQFIIFNKFFN